MSVTLHTNFGDLKVEIFCEDTPRTAENFLALCASGYYDDCAFHRNIKGFMLQGGDPSGTGKGGKSIWGGKFGDEIRDHLKLTNRGILAMANSGENTNASQFFVTYAKAPHLNGKNTVFGKIIDGHQVLDRIEKTPGDERDRPVRDVKIVNVTIHANPLA
jgi:peptidyl-prolyl cis-trans isomerase-like 3|tara:strand:- start:2722 stop:3201 length:480 start_codon:yes stop_codon:yes gene_type:complete|mmetsp:Transcript_5015/g.18724  ORF Transcript_5015/g.18724 Transcript_5015/m.18724 type:complete len:160 (+) Transcript_5015:91-570(+)|eukprot:CAMPEP_0197129082 /NCGR_PEP_ID=MMETSP1390-20130617/16101_1 /TAXON_ID=38833 /ORGANISM="Micromonas sp., Strain CCMP2099" /LENGTH=159 /DNA_ID=CAMNT_0042571473 /DNA_START=89 /DNA_END=568 /DNA_ORIENTATION=-